MKKFWDLIRPKTIDDIIGQKHVINFLKKIISKKESVSLLLHGQPGIGKTSIALAMCHDLKVDHAYFNPTIHTKKELQELIRITEYLIIDEIHRLNKDKQDILLSALEFGKIKLIATTTENPYFVINPALRSRLHILDLEKLDDNELILGIKKVIKKANLKVKLTLPIMKMIISNANGDLRYVINIIYLLEKLYSNQKITTKILQSILPNVNFNYDKNGDEHYDLLSAFHKSLRGSNVNASLYYLAQLIKSSDILGMERRIIMATYEDVGMADPNLHLRVVNAINAAKIVGFPEASIILSNIVIDICKSKKSNSAYLAINSALENIEKGNVWPIPFHLRNKPILKQNQTHYKYPHDYGGFVEQEYLPSQIKNIQFYKKNKNDKK